MSMNLNCNVHHFDLIQTPTDVSYNILNGENGQRTNEEIIKRYVAWLYTLNWAKDDYGRSVVAKHHRILSKANRETDLEFWVS